MLFGLGLVLVVIPVNSPLETLATERLLLIHLLQNVMIADWAPPLLILGLTPTMRAALARIGGRPFAALTRPVVSLPVWLVGWYAIHWGVFYDFALRHPAALNVEHLILVAIGLIFWWPLLSDEPRRVSTPMRIAYLGVGFVASAFLGLAFTFSASPFYDYYAGAPRLWGLWPAKDQNLGGMLMTRSRRGLPRRARLLRVAAARGGARSGELIRRRRAARRRRACRSPG